MVEIFQEAIKTIDPQFADDGHFSDIWIRFAQVYENNDDLESCNKIFAKATEIGFRNYEDFLNIWCSWVECLLRN